MRKVQLRTIGQGVVFSVVGFIAILAACTTGRSNHPFPTPPASPSPLSQRTTESLVPANQFIRSIDFANFTFPWLPELGDSTKTFTLNSGELNPPRDSRGMIDKMPVTLRSVAYGDLTGDAREDAMVVLSLITGGSAIPHATYIYGLQDGTPKLLWAFATGDRAAGGLRQVYAEKGELVIERYSPVEAKGDCCPTLFTRTRYKWQGSNFRQEGKEEIMANPDRHGGPIMDPYPPK